MMIPFSLLFLAISTLFGCAVSMIVGHLVPFVSALSLMVGFATAVFLARGMKLELKQKPISLTVFMLYALIVIGIYFHSIFLFYEKGGNFWIQDSFNLGDMSFHWSAIRSLAKGAHFWPENPIYAGYRFKYPFGMDLFNAFFENMGVAISTHLPFATLLLLLLTMFTLHMTGGPLLVFAVFFSCGYFNFLEVTNSDYQQMQAPLDFKNIFLTILLTQRGFLYAMAAGVYLYRAVQKYFAGEWKPTMKEQIALGVIWGALGFFHLHTYAFVSLFLGLWILWKKDLKNWLVPLAVAIVLGLPFVINALIPEAGTNSLIHWNPRGWNRQDGTNYFTYWTLNMGFWIIAVVAALVIFFRKKNWNAFTLTAASFMLFILFSHLILAPWDWDNVKLLVWCYLFALMGITDLLWDRRDAGFKVILCIAFIPGFLVFTRSLPMFSHGIQWASARELNKAEVLLKDRDINDVVVISPAYDHPVLLLGNRLFMGYPGHVWSHGYDYREREQLVNRIYEADESVVPALTKDQVRWIYSGPVEKRREMLPFPPKNLLKVGEALDHDLYSIEQKSQ